MQGVVVGTGVLVNVPEFGKVEGVVLDADGLFHEVFFPSLGKSIPVPPSCTITASSRVSRKYAPFIEAYLDWKSLHDVREGLVQKGRDEFYKVRLGVDVEGLSGEEMRRFTNVLGDVVGPSGQAYYEAYSDPEVAAVDRKEDHAWDEMQGERAIASGLGTKDWNVLEFMDELYSKEADYE